MATNTVTFSENAKLEMKKDKHDFSPLNGLGDETRQTISEHKFVSTELIREALKVFSGGVTLAMAFDNEKNYHADMKTIQEELMPHLTPLAIQQYLNEKNPAEKKKLFESFLGKLEKLQTSQAENEEVTKLIKKATDLITSTKELLGKIENGDPIMLGKVNAAIAQLDEKIKDEHPALVPLKEAFILLETEAGNLVGSAEIANAKECADEFIAFAEKELEKENVPTGTKEYFKPKFDRLIQLTLGKNPYLVTSEIEVLSKELHQKTAPELLIKDASLEFIIPSITRVVLQILFNINEAVFTGIVKNVIDTHIAPGYTSYVNGLGRLAKSNNNQAKVYSEITKFTFSLIVDELIKVLRKQTDLSITLQVPSSVPFNIVDKAFSDLQLVILKISPADLLSDDKRYKSSEVVIKRIKDALKQYFKNDADLDDAQIKILVDGTAFEMALKRLPVYLSEKFSETKPEENVAKQ